MRVEANSRSAASAGFELSHAAIDRLSEIANIGAGHAAMALTQLVGREVWMSPPKVSHALDVFGRKHERDVEDAWCSGVFFELDGELSALVGLLVRRSGRDAIVQRVLGEDADQLDAWCVESALMEVGNILVSHVATAIANTLGGRELPGLPQLVLDGADDELLRLVHARRQHGPIRIESELADVAGRLGGLLVLVPDR